MEHRYNYVIFNSDDPGLPTLNEEGYYSICLKDIWHKDYVHINAFGFDYLSPFIVRVVRRLMSIVEKRMPFFLKIFFKRYVKFKFKNADRPICFVCFRYVELPYLQYLKQQYPNAKFVKFVRDIISTQQEYYDKYKDSNIFNYWITYDEGEAKHYGMKYFNEIESKIELPDEAKEIKYDVFFAARAKKRLPQIIKVYDKLVSQGVKPFF